MNKQELLKKWGAIGKQSTIATLSTARIENHGEDFKLISEKGLESLRRDSRSFLKALKSVNYSQFYCHGKLGIS